MIVTRPHPLETLIQCTACDGEGGFVRVIRVYELGCGFAHDDECEGERCRACNGTGYVICEAQADCQKPSHASDKAPLGLTTRVMGRDQL